MQEFTHEKRSLNRCKKYICGKFCYSNYLANNKGKIEILAGNSGNTVKHPPEVGRKQIHKSNLLAILWCWMSVIDLL